MTSAERPVRIDLGYRGGAFFGSQRQLGARTVQEELESAIAQVTGHPSALAFAGRTDRGVHAVGQVASGRVNWDGDLERLRYALDSVTGDDLIIRDVVKVDHAFHARFSATRREYRYRIWNAPRSPVLMADTAWWVRPALELERLEGAARRLIGRRDFRSFTGKGFGSGSSKRNTVRAVDTSEWYALSAEFEPFGRVIEYRISADSFLPHMVRNIVGALVEVGTGNRPIDWLDELIERRDRRKAPPPAPPHGLVMWKVEYENDGGPH